MRRAAEDSDVIIASTGGKVLRFGCKQVGGWGGDGGPADSEGRWLLSQRWVYATWQIRSAGRTSRGSRAMGLQENDRVTSLDICPSEPECVSPPFDIKKSGDLGVWGYAMHPVGSNVSADVWMERLGGIDSEGGQRPRRAT